MKPEQTYIPGTEPTEPNPEIKSALDLWLDAKDEQRQSAERTRLRHDTMIGKMVELGIDRYPYLDPTTGKRKHVLADRTPKAKIVNAPVERKREGRRGRENDVEATVDRLKEAIPDGTTLTITAGGRSAKVEHRRVSRASVEKEIDPFAATRAEMDKV